MSDRVSVDPVITEAQIVLVVGAVPARGDRCDLCWRRAFALELPHPEAFA